MVGRRWPADGMSHVASNIHVAGGEECLQSKSSNMQIARLALSEVNEKMRGRYIDPSLRSMEELTLHSHPTIYFRLARRPKIEHHSISGLQLRHSQSLDKLPY